MRSVINDLDPARGSAGCRLKDRNMEDTEWRIEVSGSLNRSANRHFTGRAAFVDQVRRALASAKRRKDYQFAVLFLDLDRFEMVSQSLGHEVAGQILSNIGSRLRACLREQDMVTYLHSDEFAILLEDIRGPQDVAHSMERIQDMFVSPIKAHNTQVFCSASTGVAIGSANYQEFAEDLLRDAEIACARARARGIGQYELFDRTMHERAVGALRLETELRYALERRELRLHYQPIMCLASNRIAGFEALARWKHPERGMVYPDEFIPVVESSGLAVAFGQCMLREACAQIALWRSQNPKSAAVPVNVNLVSKDLARPGISSDIAAILSENDLEPSDLGLEITESQVMENTEPVCRTQLALHDLGIKIAIDDFGTGFSSLSYLSTFRVHALKIDRSFIGRLDGDERNAALVHAIVSLGKNLGLQVVAEGVETKEQADFLRRIRCPYAQGYYFARPMEPEAAAQFLDRRA
jgi:diguanylate cyclase (GGDEF)-like protein